MGGSHALVLTNHMVWCWRCGACACVRARLLTQDCPGKAAGWMAQARQRMLLGLHPHTRVPLGGQAVPMPGEALPAQFFAAVRAAEGTATSAQTVPHPRRDASRGDAGDDDTSGTLGGCV